MSKGINKVILIGNLGADPEVRYTQGSNIPVCNLSVATTKAWTGQDGQKQERTEWHRVTLYRKLAEIAGEYLHKGSQVYIEGELSTRKWQDKDGQDRYTTEIICNEMQMLGGGKSGGAGQGQGGGNPPPQSRPQQGQNGGQNGGGQRPPQNQARQNQPQGGQFDDFGFEGPEDEIPF